MKILVTGASGFIGNHLVENLLKRGHEVIASSSKAAHAADKPWFSKVKFREYSIGLVNEEENLFDFFERPELMIHLAWQGLPNYKNLFHLEKNLFSHIYFLKNLFSNGLRHIAVTGTCLEYGMQEGCLREDLPPMPANAYAIAKDSLRRYLELLKEEYNFDFKWIRLFYTYGPGQNPKSLIPLLKTAIDKREVEFKMSGGEQVRDYLSVEELADKLASIAIQDNTNGIFNCCSGKPITVKQLVENYIGKQHSDIRLNMGYFPYTDYEPKSFWGDDTKTNKILRHK